MSNLEVEIACVEREVQLRERVYSRLVAQKKMSKPMAERELAAMRAVLVRLNSLLVRAC